MKFKSLFPLFLLLIFSAFLQAQEGVHWSDPISLTEEGNKSPVIGLLADDTPIAVWGRGSLIYFSKKSDANFSVPQVVSTNGTTANIYSFGGLDVATFENNIFIVFENFNDGVFLIRSQDGGDTFEPPINVYNPIPGKWATLSSVEVDDQGNPIVAVILENTNETQGTFILMTSSDGGASFASPVIASEPAMGEYVCECCPADILAEEDNIWLVFRNNDNNLRDMWVTKSTDNGSTFNEAVDVDDTDWTIPACPISGPNMAPLAGDSLMTIWLSGASGTSRVSISTLNGVSMEKGLEMEIPLVNSGGFQSNPDIAGANDTIGLVWEESGFGTTGIDIMFALSKNGSADVLDNKINISEVTGSQKFPSLTYANGFFHLIYTDGSSGLTYRKGEVAAVSSTSFASNSDNCWEVKNTSSGKINVSFSCPSTFETVLFQCHDLSGRLIRTWSPKATTSNKHWELDISHEPMGIYFISAIMGKKEQHWIQKFVLLPN